LYSYNMVVLTAVLVTRHFKVGNSVCPSPRSGVRVYLPEDWLRAGRPSWEPEAAPGLSRAQAGGGPAARAARRVNNICDQALEHCPMDNTRVLL
jgi:hypothetical protein